MIDNIKIINSCLKIQDGHLLKFDESKTIKKTIVIPEGITVICKDSFKNCVNIESVILPKTLKTIEENAFQSCANLKSVLIPFGITSIQDGAFSSCQSLTTIELPISIINVGKKLFSGCKKLKKIEFSNSNLSYSFNNGFETVNDCLTFFDHTINTEQNLTIPYGVTTIGEKAFYKCNTIIVVTIPTSVKGIENGAFASCSSLCIVDYPMNILNFGRGIFANCTELMPIKIVNRLTNYYFVNGLEIHDRCLTFFDQTINKGKNINIPHGVTSIGEYAFQNCTNIRTVTFPKNLRMIEEGAFAGSGITDITIPEEITSIEKNTFYKCNNLRNINIPDSVKFIDESSFLECPNLQDNFQNNGNNIKKYFGLEPVC